MPIGFSLNPIEWVEDAWNTVSNVADRVWDVADNIPGVAEFGSGFRSLVTGPLRDVANSAAGQIVLRALAGSVYAAGATALGPMLGPQLASAAFAIPGVARGEDFWSSWFQESWYRAKEAASILGPGAVDDAIKVADFKKIGDELKSVGLGSAPALEQVAGRLGIPTSFDAEAFAKRLGVSEYAAAKVLARMFPDRFSFNPNFYDPLSGNRKPGIALVFRPPPSVAKQAAVASGINAALQELIAKQQAAEQKAAIVAFAARAPELAAMAKAKKLESAGNVALVGVATAGALAAAWWYFERRR